MIRSQQLGSRAGRVAARQRAQASTIPVAVSYRHVMCSAQSRSQPSTLTGAPSRATDFDLILLTEQAHPQAPSSCPWTARVPTEQILRLLVQSHPALVGALTIGPHPRIWPVGDSAPSTSPGDGAWPPPLLVCKCGLPKLCRGEVFGQRVVKLSNSWNQASQYWEDSEIHTLCY